MSDAAALEAFYLSDDIDEVVDAAAAIGAASSGALRRPDLTVARTGKPERDGPLCARIFGPVEDYRCLCGKLDDRAHAGEICDKCGVLCGESSLRAERWGHIESPLPLLHPVIAPHIADLLGLRERALLRVARRTAKLGDDGVLVLAKRSELGMRFSDEEDDDDAADAGRLARGLERVYQLLVAVDARHDELMPRQVPVPPAAWRGGQRDPQDAVLVRLINRRNRYARLIELDAPPIIIDNEEVLLFDTFRTLLSTVRRELRARRAQPATRARDAEREDALLAAIRANPSDDAARAVYADFLLAHGDPRGEFITMQLANADAARMSSAESKLLRRHYDDWIGALGRAAAADGYVVFRRGFPVSIKVDDKRVGELAGDAAWATIEHVESGSADLLVDPALRSLTRLSTTFHTLRTIAGRSHVLPTVRSALVRMGRTPPRDYQTVTRSAALPALRELTLISAGRGIEEDWSWLDGAPLTRQLEALTVASITEHLSGVSLDSWLDFFARHALSALSLTFDRKALCFDIRDEGRLDVTMTIRFFEYAALLRDRGVHEALSQVLLATDARRWRRVRLIGSALWLDDLFAEMCEQLREHYGDVVELPTQEGQPA